MQSPEKYYYNHSLYCGEVQRKCKDNGAIKESVFFPYYCTTLSIIFSHFMGFDRIHAARENGYGGKSPLSSSLDVFSDPERHSTMIVGVFNAQ